MYDTASTEYVIDLYKYTLHCGFVLDSSQFFSNTSVRSISSTFYEQLLHVQIPEVQKDSQVGSLFCAFLGSARAKALGKMLVKLTPGAQKPLLISKVVKLNYII